MLFIDFEHTHEINIYLITPGESVPKAFTIDKLHKTGYYRISGYSSEHISEYKQPLHKLVCQLSK